MTNISKKKNKRVDPITDHPGRKPFIVMNEYLQVWVGLRDGGRNLAFSDNFDDAKPLHYDEQFKTLDYITTDKLEQIYI